MTTPAGGVLRMIRALALVVTLAAVSVTAHVAAGGAAPGVLASAGLGAVFLAAAVQLARHRLRGPALAGVLGLGQLGLHHALMLFSGGGGCAPAASGHAAHGHAAPAPMPGMCEPAAAAPEASAPGLTMLLAHAAATLVCTLLLSLGERALWALAELRAWLWPRLVLVAAQPVPVPRPRALADVPAAVRPADVFLRAAPRRGPPAPLRPVLAPPA